MRNRTHSLRSASLAAAVAAALLAPATAAALPKILLCYVDKGINVPTVTAGLNPNNAVFAGIDALDCSINTPSLQTLKGYDGVLLWTSGTYQDRVGLGNNLADYVDAGGGVVQGMYNFYNPGGFGFDLQGRWSQGGYSCITSGNIGQNATLANAPKDPNSPLVAGVSKLTATIYGTGGLAKGATSIWDYNNGQPAIAQCMPNGKLRVDNNFYLNPNNWTGDGYVIMRNSLLAVTGGLSPLRGTPSPVAFPSTGTGGVSAPVTVTFTNSSMAAATATSLAVTGANAAEFSVVKQPQFPVTLQPGQTFTVDIAFAPVSMGARTAKLTVVVAQQQGMMAPPAAAEVILNGTGIGAKLAVTPSPINCGGTQIGIKVKTNVTVSNGGGGKIQVLSMSVADPAFVLTGVPDLPLSIGNGGAFTVGVEFTPQKNGITSDSVVITTNDPNTPTLKIPVSGFAGPPAISVTGSIFFGNINVGARSEPNAVVVTNAGFSDLKLLQADLSGNNVGDFTVDVKGIPIGGIIPAQSSASLMVTFAPQVMGQRDATLTLTSNDANAPSKIVKLIGVGTQATLSVSPKVPLDFGLVRVATTSKPQDITLAAAGTGAILVKSLTFTGANASVFQQVGGQVPPYTITPNSQSVIQVACKPDALGGLAGSADVVTDVGMGSVALKCAGTSPRITVTPNFIDFGTLPLNATSPKVKVEIANNGTDTLEIKDLSIDGIDSSDFVSLNLPMDLPVVIAAGQKLSFDVAFVPTTDGAESAHISFYTDDPLLPSGRIEMVGEGATTGLVLAPQPLDFGPVILGGSVGPLAASITNKGELPVVINSVTVGGGGAASFRITPTIDMNSRVTLAPGQSIGLQVTFVPANVGTLMSPLIVNAQGLQAMTLTLKGSCYVAALQFGIPGGGGTLDFGEVPVGGSSDRLEVQVLNAGMNTVTLDRVVSDNPQFVVDTSSSTFTLAPKDKTSLYVTFKPTKIDSMASGRLSAFLPGAAAASVNLKLTGNGVPASPQMNNNDTGCSISRRPLSRETAAGEVVLAALLALATVAVRRRNLKEVR